MKFIYILLFLPFLAFAGDLIQSGDEIKAKRLNESLHNIGDIKHSLLTESEFQSLNGTCWKLMQGQNISGSDLAQHTGGRLNNLPDARNRFLRNADGTTSAGLGSAQAQDWKGFYMNNTVRNGSNYTHGPIYMGKSTNSYIGNLFTGYWAGPAAAIGMQWDGSEIRPQNLSVNMFVKIDHECD